MPGWISMPEVLLFVFATHLPFFAWRYHRTGELRYGATALTFLLLAISYALRVFAPESDLWGVALHRIVRAPALLAAAVSVSLLLRHHLRRARSRADSRASPG